MKDSKNMTAEELKIKKADALKVAKERGVIGYKYLAGSHSQNLNGPDSDVDYHGVYFAEYRDLLDFGDDYLEEIADPKNDEKYHEFGKWMWLLAKGNPDAIETLYVPENMVVGEVHPVIKNVLENRDKFVSKQVVSALTHYAFDQVKKARGLNKKIVNPVTERKDILDFCYTFKGQGSQPIKDFLAENKLDQKYCGLVNIPNMRDVYGVYYDWAAYFHFENIDWWCIDFQIEGVKSPYSHFLTDAQGKAIKERIKNKQFFGYPGIVHPDELEKSNEVRLSSIPKGEVPICFMTYNKDAYTCHCREYREYQEWVKDRNQKRYSKAEEAGYNQKNMCHCIRLLTMAKEVSEGKGFNLWRTDDRDFLMDIKNGEYTYEFLMDYAEKLVKEVEKNLPNSELPDEVDRKFVNDLLYRCRIEYYTIYAPF